MELNIFENVNNANMYVQITEAGGFCVYGIIQYGDEDGKRLCA